MISHDHRPTIRLALTYLGIIMVLSIGFSFIFFFTSSGSLQVNTQTAPDAELIGPPVGNRNFPNGENIQMTPDASNIDGELTKRLDSVRQDLAQRLVLLNLGALILGSVLSYYLARRTLRPIERSMEAQSRFSSDASHELRTPLAALRTRSEVALRDPKLTLAQAKTALENSVEQAIQLERLADGLLKLSRSDGRPLTLGPVKLHEVAKKATEQLQSKAEARHITIHHSVPSALTGIGDADSLTQVLCILLDNAIKYSPKGSRITIRGHKGGTSAILSIQDHGAGISPSDLPHIFERFYRADHARHDEQSYGLGLAIAQQLVDQNKGTIKVKSALGKGSIFTITLSLS